MTSPLNDTRGDDILAANLITQLAELAREIDSDAYRVALIADEINTTPEVVDALRLALNALADVRRLIDDALDGPYGG